MALAGGLLLSFGCAGSARTPTGLGGGGQQPGVGTGGTGGGGIQTGSDLLVGTWANVQLYRTDQDLIRITTTWSFGVDGHCVRRIENFSLALGYPLRTVTACTWAMQGNDVAVTFAGGPGVVLFPVTTVDFSHDRIDIGGYRFERQS